MHTPTSRVPSRSPRPRVRHQRDGSPPSRPGAAGLVALACVLVGCAGEDAGPAGWSPLEAAELTAPQQAQETTALEARDAMFAELLATLTAELETSGPVGAIAVCKTEAPRIAAAVGERFGVRMGRTSDRLRNPGNAGPEWAAALLADRPEEPRLVSSPAGELGLTSPIRVAGKCLLCHGPEESLGDELREALARHYPDDAATGYSAGDLRGWFWVEVPASVQ